MNRHKSTPSPTTGNQRKNRKEILSDKEERGCQLTELAEKFSLHNISERLIGGFHKFRLLRNLQPYSFLTPAPSLQVNIIIFKKLLC